jgi:hypothetical protein
MTAMCQLLDRAAMLLHPRGDCNPHQIERLRELRPDVGHAGGPPSSSLGPFLVENLVLVVEGVEFLRQAEGVLRQQGELL